MAAARAHGDPTGNQQRANPPAKTGLVWMVGERSGWAEGYHYRDSVPQAVSQRFRKYDPPKREENVPGMLHLN